MNPYLVFIAASILETCASRLKALAKRAIVDEAPLDARQAPAHYKTIEHGIKLLRSAMTES